MERESVCVRDRVCMCACACVCVCCTASGVGELCIFEIQSVCVCVKESVCACACVCVLYSIQRGWVVRLWNRECVCVRVWESERERERERESMCTTQTKSIYLPICFLSHTRTQAWRKKAHTLSHPHLDIHTPIHQHTLFLILHTQIWRHNPTLVRCTKTPLESLSRGTVLVQGVLLRDLRGLLRYLTQEASWETCTRLKRPLERPVQGPCTGWQRLIGSPKRQIFFHKRATKYRSLLRKMTYEDKGSYESSPPCTKSRSLNKVFIHTHMYRHTAGKSCKRILWIQHPCIESCSLNKESISIYTCMYQYTDGKSPKRIFWMQHSCIESRSLNKISMTLSTWNPMGSNFWFSSAPRGKAKYHIFSESHKISQNEVLRFRSIYFGVG